VQNICPLTRGYYYKNKNFCNYRLYILNKPYEIHVTTSWIEGIRLTEQTEKPVIEIKSLVKHFGPIHAVQGISFSLNKGEVLGFLGPNGAGKSTTMKMVTGFLEPTAGSVSVCGYDILENPIEAKKKIGYLPEGAPLYGEMTVTAFLNFIADVRGMTGKAREDRIEEVIQKINLQSVRTQTLETLSKGYKRRVGLAHAILHDPEILIMDEPTDGLDPNQKHEVRTLIKEMASEKAIIISTHILEEVDAVCTRAIIIASGKLLFDGTPAELLAKSTNGKLDDVFRDITLKHHEERGVALAS
jgi:ABC-2 type transport system ATP-binding protein